MDYKSFAQRVVGGLPPDTVLKNPGKGTSTIVWCDDERLCYQRGGSRFYVDLQALYGAYHHFKGQEVTTSDLKAYAPGVFDSANGGHNCNATVLFLILVQLGMADRIWGHGYRGSPFGVTLGGEER